MYNGAASAQINALQARAGLEPIEFNILATLRRSGEEVMPTRLYQTLMLSFGAMSAHVENEQRLLAPLDVAHRHAYSEAAVSLPPIAFAGVARP